MHALISLLFLTILLRPARSVYFYIEGTTPKCFYEELRKDTLVVGHYSAEEYSPQTNSYVKNDALGIFISVDEMFENEHRIVSSKGSSTGKFTFTAADSGDHKLCFTPSHSTGHSGWLHSGQSLGGVKLTLDLAIGETSAIESADKDKIQDIVQKVKDLNMRLQDIKREQIFQREREAEFRDQSESTNARVVRWTLIQLVVLAITCAWQLSHLRSFFIKQKLT